MRGPTLAGIQLLGGYHLLVLGIEITDIIPGQIQTVAGPFVVGRGVWAHESLLTISNSPRFHGSITISDCDIRDFVSSSDENAPISVEDFDQSKIPINIEDNSVGGTNVLFGIATTGLVTPTTWVVDNDIDATGAVGGLSVRIHPAGVPGEIHIEDNTVTGGLFGMLWFFASAGGSTVHNNRIRDSFIGIALHGSNGHDFDDNRITDVVFGIRLGLKDVFPLANPSVPSNGSTFSDIRVSEAEYGLYVTEGATDNVFCDLSFKQVTVSIFEDTGTSSIFPCDDD
jgi:parallel beta-helix repeat protein